MNIDHSDTRPSRGHLPGGNMSFARIDDSSPLLKIIGKWKDVLHGDEWGFPCMRDADFVEQFVSAVPNPDEQIKYVQNTSEYITNFDRTKCDPNYVLVFRRTLPSDNPKPEQHWTTDYMTARSGLQQEISGPHRLYSVVACTTLSHLEQIGIDHSGQPRAMSDGEIKVLPIPIDQKQCLLSFRPITQQAQLDLYQNTTGAMTLSELLQALSQVKK